MTTCTRLSATLVATVTLMALSAPPLGAVGDAPPTAPPRVFHIMIANPVVRQRVELALQGAAHRLAGSECQKVFTEFEDGAGQPLQSKLDALHQTGADFLTWLRFTEGDVRPLCRQTTNIAAFTQPGSRVVQVCGAVFARQSAQDSCNQEPVLGPLLCLECKSKPLGLHDRR